MYVIFDFEWGEGGGYYKQLQYGTSYVCGLFFSNIYGKPSSVPSKPLSQAVVF